MTDEFIEQQMLQAAGYAALFAGMSDQDTLGLLYDVREMKKIELAETFDEDIAGFIAEAFVNCIAQGKAELEAANQGKKLQ